MPRGEAGESDPNQSVLRIRAVRGLLGAQFISVTGDYAYMVGLGVWLWDETGSAIWVAASVLARMIPRVLLGRRAGAMADRLERRRLLTTLDLCRGVVTAVLAVAMLHHIDPIGVVVTTAIVAALSTPYGPASVKYLGEIVGPAKQSHLNTAYEFSAQLAVFVGPAVAAGLVLISSSPWAIVFNAGTFFAAAALVQLLPRRIGTADQPAKSTNRDRHAIRNVLDDWALRAIGITVFAQTAQFGFEQAALPLLADDIPSLGAGGTGTLFAALGLGGLLAAPVATRLGQSKNWSATLGLTFAAEAIGVGALALGIPASAAVAAMLFAGVASFCFEIVVLSALQTIVAPARFGLVYGTLGAVSAAGTLCGALVLPVLIDRVGLKETTIGFTLLSIVAGISMPLLIRTLERPELTSMTPLAPRVEAQP